MSTNKPKSGAVTGDQAFQRWLGRQLHKLYDDVLAEDVPEELLRVVYRATGGSNGAGAEKPAAESPSGNGSGADKPAEGSGAAKPAKNPGKAKRNRR